MANYTANHTSLPVWHYTSSNSLEDKNSPSCYSLPTKWTKTSEWVFTFTLHWIGGWHWIVSGVHHQLQYKGLLPFQHIHDSAKLNTKLHKYMHTAFIRKTHQCFENSWHYSKVLDGALLSLIALYKIFSKRYLMAFENVLMTSWNDLT